MTAETTAPAETTADPDATAADPDATAAATTPFLAEIEDDEDADVDEHEGHTTIDSHMWDEEAGASVAFRQCSCGASRPPTAYEG